MDKKQSIGKITKEDKEFFVFDEINESQVDELFFYAQNDPLVKRNTSDAQRFNDRSSFSSWQKGKTIYTLSDQKQEFLGGIIWLENKIIPQRAGQNPADYPITIALRVYGSLRGKHLSLPFVVESLKNYFPKNPNLPGIWLETSYNNEALIKVFSQLNFVKVCEADERGKIIMVAKKKDIHV